MVFIQIFIVLAFRNVTLREFYNPDPDPSLKITRLDLEHSGKKRK